MTFKNHPLFKLLKLFNAGFGKYKLKITGLSILSFVSSLLEGVGINAVIPLLAFVNVGPAEPGDLISQTIEKFFHYFNISYTLKHLLILIAFLFLIKTVVFFIGQCLTFVIQADYERNTRNELFKLTLGGNWTYLSKQKIGYLEQTLIMNVEQSSKILIYVFGFILSLANLMIYSFVAMSISLTIAILALIFGILVFYFFKPLFRKNRMMTYATIKGYKKLAHYINENIIGMKAIKSSFVERQIMQKISGYFDGLRSLRIKLGLLGSFGTAILQPIPLLFILGIFAIFYKASIFNFSSFAVVIYAVNRVFGSVQLLQAETNTLVSLVPHLSSVLSYRDEAKLHKEEDVGIRKFNFNDRLEFKNVVFAYDAEHQVLYDVNFYLKKGEMLGLIGPSGAGKTTIVDLFLRLLKPQKGYIFLDGVDISDIRLEDWRTNVGYVSQDVFLFNDTIANNIRFYNESMTDQGILEAAKMANIYDFIQEQPQQFETMVGERGIMLSGGQRQRIALARILARKPSVLILDEATSALDNESEVLIQKAIEDLRGRVTVVAIAHRLSTVINFDRLIVLENGKVKEEGAPQDLLKDKGSYFSKVYNLKEKS